MSQRASVDRDPKSAALLVSSRLTRGAFRDRHERWCGMRWTRLRRKTSGVFADGEVVWFWHLDADAKSAVVLASWPATVTKKPDHREEREGNR
jgi:hypothetical protein